MFVSFWKCFEVFKVHYFSYNFESTIFGLVSKLRPWSWFWFVLSKVLNLDNNTGHSVQKHYNAGSYFCLLTSTRMHAVGTLEIFMFSVLYKFVYSFIHYLLIHSNSHLVMQQTVHCNIAATSLQLSKEVQKTKNRTKIEIEATNKFIIKYINQSSRPNLKSLLFDILQSR